MCLIRVYPRKGERGSRDGTLKARPAAAVGALRCASEQADGRAERCAQGEALGLPIPRLPRAQPTASVGLAVHRSGCPAQRRVIPAGAVEVEAEEVLVAVDRTVDGPTCGCSCGGRDMRCMLPPTTILPATNDRAPTWHTPHIPSAQPEGSCLRGRCGSPRGQSSNLRPRAHARTPAAPGDACRTSSSQRTSDVARTHTNRSSPPGGRALPGYARGLT